MGGPRVTVQGSGDDDLVRVAVAAAGIARWVSRQVERAAAEKPKDVVEHLEAVRDSRKQKSLRCLCGEKVACEKEVIRVCTLFGYKMLGLGEGGYLVEHVAGKRGTVEHACSSCTASILYLAKSA